MLTRLFSAKPDRKLPDRQLRTSVLRGSPLLRKVDSDRLAALEQTAAALLDQVEICGAEDFRLSQEMLWRIAMEAALVLSGPGLEACGDWRTLVVFADAFVHREPLQDEWGIVHTDASPRSGECWVNGPMLISWQDLLDAGPGYHVLVHEIAHRLDVGNGSMNGFPPLPRSMSQRDWTTAFSAAYDDHCQRVENKRPSAIDPYGAESPEEFFAVCCESFFTDYTVLANWQPAVARLLVAYFQFTPLGQIYSKDSPW